MTLTKESLKDSISNHLNISTKESAALFETLMETIKLDVMSEADRREV